MFLKKSPIISAFLTLSCLSFDVFAKPQTYLCRFSKPELTGESAYPFANKQAVKGGDISMGSTESTFDTLNPFIVLGNPASGVMETFDPLMRRSPKEPFTLYANIAKTVDLSKDNSTITFALDKDARFHDGSPITSHDIKATVEALMEKGWPRYKKFYGQIKSIECPNAETIKFTLKPLANGSYDPELPFIIASIRPLCKKQLESIDLKTSGLTVLMGSGPLKISKVEPGHYIVYERVKDYWAKDKGVNQGTYNFDSLKVIYYKNAQVHLNAFFAGEVDLFVPQDLQTFSKIVDAKKGKSGHALTALSKEHTLPVIVRTLAFNMRRDKFKDPNVRQALNVLFDFSTFNKVSLNNAFKRAKSLFENTTLSHKGPLSEGEKNIISQNAKIFTKEILESLETPYDFDTLSSREVREKADELLKKAGYSLNSKGKRVDASGTPLSYEIIYKDPKLEKFVNFYKKCLSVAGIEVTARFIDTVQYENRTSSHDFDMIVHSWANSRSPGVEQSYYFDSKQADIQGSGNYIGTKDPVLDWLSSQVSLTTDYDDLKNRVHLLDRYVMKNYFMVPLFYDNTSYMAFNKNKVEFPAYDDQVGFKLEYAYKPQTPSNPN